MIFCLSVPPSPSIWFLAPSPGLRTFGLLTHPPLRIVLLPNTYKLLSHNTLDVFWICPPLFQTRVCPVDAERQVVPSKQQRARQTDPGWRKEEIAKPRAKQHSKLPSTSHTSMNYILRRIRFSAFATCIIEKPSDNADLLGKTGRFPKKIKALPRRRWEQIYPPVEETFKKHLTIRT